MKIKIHRFKNEQWGRAHLPFFEGLVPFYQEEFSQIVWVCKVKQ